MDEKPMWFKINKECKYKEEWYAYPFCIKSGDKIVLEHVPMGTAKEVMRLLNEQVDIINSLNELINLIADAGYGENSVKEILRKEIYGLDTVAGESANAFNQYCILSRFFKEHYKEHWDNYE